MHNQTTVAPEEGTRAEIPICKIKPPATIEFG